MVERDEYIIETKTTSTEFLLCRIQEEDVVDIQDGSITMQMFQYISIKTVLHTCMYNALIATSYISPFRVFILNNRACPLCFDSQWSR